VVCQREAVHPCRVMSAVRAREIYQLLTGQGIRCWVVGGWGIDALLGRESRAHKDLDVLLVSCEHLGAWQLLHRAGFLLAYRWEENEDVVWDGAGGITLPTAYVLSDREESQIDVHVLGDDLSPMWITDRALIVGALEASGTIDGLTVACMSAPMQRIAHTGYVLPQEQRRDLQLLDDVDP
jgi:lincosamide nucleotidyltransferase A/C/D/E